MIGWIITIIILVVVLYFFFKPRRSSSSGIVSRGNRRLRKIGDCCRKFFRGRGA